MKHSEIFYHIIEANTILIIQKIYYNVRYKKMFGEYMVFVDEKPVLLVCDNEENEKTAESA